MRRPIYLLFVLILAAAFNLAHAVSPEGVKPIPDALKPWVDWVKDSNHCPQVTGKKDQNICAWPGELRLSKQDKNLSFEQSWRVYKPSMIPLPGDPGSWPEKVAAAGKRIPVIARGGRPFVQLQQGSYQLRGVFSGNQGDKAFQLPAGVALVSYEIAGVASPVYIDPQNYLWFKPIGVRNEPNITPEKNSLSLKVFRKFNDAVPTDVTTTLRLTVSGKKREVKLGRVLIPDAIPYAIRGQLPASMNESGEVSIIVQPGIWEIHALSYLPSEMKTWKRGVNSSEFWPTTEYWFFQRMADLFRSKVSGAAVIDPKSVDAPNAWGSLAGYAIPKDGQIAIEHLTRGTNTSGETRATINREAWLSLDGERIFIQDRVQGAARPYSSLTVLPEQFQPQSLYLNGEPQVLTQSENGIGVSLRQRNLDARVLGKMEVDGGFQLPGNAYHELQADSLDTELHLPPGWRVLHASDAVEGRTWISSWTFYQVFLLIIISIVFFRMVGPFWGIFAGITLGISFHEPETPILMWLLLLALIAILREGMGNYPRLNKLLGTAKTITLIGIGFMLLAYTVNHIKDAIHPQLNWYVGSENFNQSRATATSMEQMAAPAPAQLQKRFDKSASGAMSSSSYDGNKRLQFYETLDSDSAVIDEAKPEYKRENEMPATSGLPQWTGEVVYFGWNQGALQNPNPVKLTMMSPFMNAVFGFVSSIMLIVLFLAVIGVRLRGLLDYLPGIGKKSAVALLLSLFFAGSAQGKEDEFPPEYLLKQLANEVNQPAACLPDCASTDRLDLSLNESGQLTLHFKINVLENIALPLISVPATGVTFTGFSRFKDQQKSLPLMRQGGLLLANLEHGEHEVILIGNVTAEKMQIALPLTVRNYNENLSGWHSNHTVRKQLWHSLSFKSIKPDSAKTAAIAEPKGGLPQTSLPGYFSVTRQLQLNSGIFLDTRINRLSPPGSVEEVSIPAWQQEVLLSSATYLRRDGDIIKVTFGVNEHSRHFRSSLQFTDDELAAYKGGILRSLELPAAGDAQLTTWSFDYSGLWDIDVAGLPLIYQQNARGSNQKMLRPWSGEKATVNLYRAAPVPASTVAVQNANIRIMPYAAGEGSSQGLLEFQAKIETTRAQTLVLKTDAKLKEIQVNGSAINSEPGSEIRVPFDVGDFNLTATGELTQGITTNYKMPEFSIETQGGESVEIFNVTAQIEMPDDRWVFSADGDGVGPDFLFWSILPTLIILAVVLHTFKLGGLNGIGWFLLMIGFTQANSFGLYFGIGMSTLFIGWLYLLRQRENTEPFKMTHTRFNLFQILLIVLSFGVLISMANGLYSGLLGNPKMQVAGNGSNAYFLQWFNDQGMPDASVKSLPIIFYRVVLLIWEIWLSFIVIGWAKYAWNTFTKETMFRSAPEVAAATKIESGKSETAVNENTQAGAAVPKTKGIGAILLVIVLALIVIYLMLGRIF